MVSGGYTAPRPRFYIPFAIRHSPLTTHHSPFTGPMTTPIFLLAPAPGMTFVAMPSGATYVADENGLIVVAGGDVADQLALTASGCATLEPNAGGAVAVQTGTSYTVRPADNGANFVFANASAIAVTLPNDAPVGFALSLYQGGAGQVTAQAASGGSVVTPNIATTPGPYTSLYCICIANAAGNTAQWDVIAEPSVTGGGVVGASTLAALYTQDTSAHYAQYAVAQVFSDSTTANDGYWLKTGTGNGSGNWTQQNAITLASLNAAIVAETARAEAEEAALVTTLLSLQPYLWRDDPTFIGGTFDANGYATDAIGAFGQPLGSIADQFVRLTYLWGDEATTFPAGNQATVDVNGNVIIPYNPIVATNTASIASNTGSIQELETITGGLGYLWRDDPLFLGGAFDASGRPTNAIGAWGQPLGSAMDQFVRLTYLWLDETIAFAAGTQITVDAGGNVVLSYGASGVGAAPSVYGTDTSFAGPANPQTGSVYGTLTIAEENANFVDMYVGIGQSRDQATNQAAFDAPFITSALDPGNVLMLNQGLYPNGAASASFVNAYAQAQNGAIEPFGPMAGHMIWQAFTNAGLTGPKLLFVVAARGGTPYVGIKRGTTVYAQAMQYVQEAVAIAKANGQTLRVRGLATRHGEEDAPVTPRDEYAQDMLTLRRDFETDVKTYTGQVEPVKLFTCQHEYATQLSPILDHVTALAQLDMTDIDPANANLTTPNYWIGPQDNAGGPNAGAHFMAMGYVQFDELEGLSIWRSIYGPGFRPLRISKGRPGLCWTSATTFELVYTQAVLIDTSNAIVDATQLGATTGSNNNLYGFVFDDGSGSAPAISSIAPVGRVLTATIASDTITFTGTLAEYHREAVVIVYDGVKYCMEVDNTFTTTSIAAGFAAAISGASAAGAVLTLPGPPTSATVELEIVSSARWPQHLAL